ncbi:MAG TPA: four helix bundle protein [Longimicrobiales bacterium]
MSFAELRVQAAAELLRVEVVGILRGVPEELAVWKQLDRATESVVANISEARGQRTEAQRAHYFAIARGSSDEVRGCLNGLITRGLVTPKQVFRAIGLTHAIGKMLTSLINRIAGNAG